MLVTLQGWARQAAAVIESGVPDAGDTVIVTLLAQKLKAWSRMLLTPAPIVTLARLRQSSKACTPMLTLLGMVTLPRLVRFSNT